MEFINIINIINKMIDKKYLNLGCGTDRFYGCINIDSRESCNPDLVCDIKELPYEPNSIDGIYALDVLEHIPRGLVLSTLESWYKILKVGGFLILRLPDIRSISEKYLKGKIDANEFARLIYGGQEDNEFENFHKSGFDEKTLVKLLKYIGFKKLKEHIEIPCNDNNMLIKVEKK